MLTLRYAITDRTQYGKTEADHRAGLVEQAVRLAAEGIDFIQLREKDLGAKDLIGVARGMISAMRHAGSRMRLVVNGRADVALAAGADGVHLPSGADQLRPEQVRRLFSLRVPLVSVSCHTVDEVRQSAVDGADLILFGPIFGKTVRGEEMVSGAGLEVLKAACEAAEGTPVLALGGVTAGNADSCMAAGASGIAGIRLFR